MTWPQGVLTRLSDVVCMSSCRPSWGSQQAASQSEVPHVPFWVHCIYMQPAREEPLVNPCPLVSTCTAALSRHQARSSGPHPGNFNPSSACAPLPTRQSALAEGLGTVLIMQQAHSLPRGPSTSLTPPNSTAASIQANPSQFPSKPKPPPDGRQPFSAAIGSQPESSPPTNPPPYAHLGRLRLVSSHSRCCSPPACTLPCPAEGQSAPWPPSHLHRPAGIAGPPRP